MDTNTETNSGDQAPAAPGPLFEPGDLPLEDGRALIIGPTRSGKTQLAIYLLRRLGPSPILIIDTKGEAKFAEQLPNSVIVHDYASVYDQVEKEGVHYIVFDAPSELAADPELLDEILAEHYESMDGVPLYLDELYSFHRAGRAGPGLVSILTRGRSRGIACLMATQRPSWISGFSMSETDRFYIFHLRRGKDRKAVADFVPGYDQLPKAGKHEFYYYDADQDAPRLVSPILPDKPIDKPEGLGTESQPDAERRPAEFHDWL